MTPLHLGTWVAALAATTIALTTPALAATSWSPFRGLRCVVGDIVDPKAMVFAGDGHFLVSPSTGTVYYLVSAKDLSVHRIRRSADAKPDDFSTIDIAKKDSYESAGVLEKDGGTLKWKDGEVRYALASKPPLIGEVTLSALREHTKKYDAEIEAYVPRAPAIEKLKAVQAPTEFVVAFGVWCPVCAEWLPRFIKTIEVAGNSNLTVRYVAMNEDLTEPAALMKELELDGVPTFAVRRGGAELGRVTGEELEADPDTILEQVIVDLATRG